jgi:hypothetical protein
MKNQRYYLALVFAFFISTSFATVRISSQSGKWSAASTWSNNAVPQAGDDVIIQGGFAVTVDTVNAACSSIQLGGSTDNLGEGTLIFNEGSQLAVTGGVHLGPNDDKTTPGSLDMTEGGTLICESISVNRLGTWTAGIGTIELTTSNTIPANNNVDFNNLSIRGGTTSLSRNITVQGDLVIDAAAGLICGNNTFTVGGNWLNDGTFNGTGGTVIFTHEGTASLLGNGLNDFNLIKVDMGTDYSNTLEVQATNFSAPDPFLTIINGTFKMSGTFSFSNSFFTGPAYNIDPTAGFWLNNPNVTVTAQAASVSLRGSLRISAGNYFIGTAINESLNYISGSSIFIEGGILHVAGRLARNNATQATTYYQLGGTVSVMEKGSTDPVFGGFDIGVVGSSFYMSGGTMVLRNATSAPVDFIVTSSPFGTGHGTIQLGDAFSNNAQIFRIQTSETIGNLFISGATAQAVKPTAKIVGGSLRVINSITISQGTALNAAGFNITISGNWIDNGSFINSNTITFNGSVIQAITSPAGETFLNLTINKDFGGVILNNNVIINGAFNLTKGGIDVNTSTLNLNGTVSGLGTMTSAVTGTVKYTMAGNGQDVLPANYGNLIFSNFDKILPVLGVVGIAGTFTPGTANGHTIAGSSIDFNGGSQTIPTFTYYNLTASGTGIKSGIGTINVEGNFNNKPGISFTGQSVLNLTGSTHVNDGKLVAATIALGPSAVFTNNDTLTAASDLSGAGTLVQAAGASLTVSGTAALAVLDAAAEGNTVHYNGTAQTVIPAIYHHLGLSGSGIKTLSGITTINGNFTLSGTVHAAAAASMYVGGIFRLNPGTRFDTNAFAIHVGN